MWIERVLGWDELMNILGIGGFSHDSAACLMQDGRIVSAVMEERLTRKKHQGGIPVKAVEWCLNSAGLTADDVDHIGFYMDWRKRMMRRLIYRSGQILRAPRYSLAYMLYEFAHNSEYLYGAYRLKGRNTRIHFLDHHHMHGASAFFASPYESAALLSIDYIGEWTSTWMGIGQGNEIRPIREIRYPQSLGVFYSAITDYLGFLRASDEYKVMGLASYGDPSRYIDAFRQIITTPVEGEYQIDLDYFQYQHVPGSRLGYFSDKFIREFGPPRKKNAPLEERHQDIAAAAQQILEETVLHLCRYLYEATGKTKRLCIGGGVGLNCSMNGRLLAESPFEEIYVQPAAGDDGIAIGAAYHLYHEVLGQPRVYREPVAISESEDPVESPSDEESSTGPGTVIAPKPVENRKLLPVGLDHVYLGPSYTNKEIEQALSISKVKHVRLEGDKLCQVAAERIAQGQIVGWFQGAMEFGPRALGSRSILADPTRPEMKDVLNRWVKHREDFRPFAPAVCEENFGDFFEHPGGPVDGVPSRFPFMLFVCPVRPEAQERIPAVTHIDGTARVQTVSREQNPLYYDLIRRFESIRGAPVIVNTSFNIRGEPIVCSPMDALKCFFTTGIDVLFMGEYMVHK